MRRRRYVYACLVLLSALIIAVHLWGFKSMSWLAGWKYRKSHVIEPASGAGTDYQIRIIVHYGSGTDSGEHVYLNGKCRSDFGDVRFTSDDGVTLLDYWIEELEDGVNKWFASNGVRQPFNHIDYPPAIYYNGKTYIVWQGTDLDPYITYYDHSAKKWGPAVRVGDNPLSGDSHGAPSLIIDAEGYIHVFYGCHQTSIIYAKSEKPEDINSWVQMSPPVRKATYPKPLRVGDEIVVYTETQTYRYAVEQTRIIDPDDPDAARGVMGMTSSPVLTLISCYPYGIDSHNCSCIYCFSNCVLYGSLREGSIKGILLPRNHAAPLVKLPSSCLFVETDPLQRKDRRTGFKL